MPKLKTATFVILFYFLFICHDVRFVHGQFESLRKFTILNKEQLEMSKIIKNMIKKQKNAAKKLKEAQQRKQEELENRRRKIIVEYLLKRVPGNVAVLKDFYSRF